MRIAFVGLSIVWAALLPVAACAASQPHQAASAWLYALAYFVYRAGRVICHQRPERSFHLFGVALPVCARCTGIYVGAAVAACAAVIRDGTRRESTGRVVSERFELQKSRSMLAALNRRVRTFGPARAVLVAAAMPSVATLAFEWSTGRMPAHWIRALSGASLGAAIAWIVYDAVSTSSRGNVIH